MEKNITLLVVILHDADRLPELLKSWRSIGIPGSTILPSAGSFMAENWVKRSGLGSFLSMFDQNILQQRTLLSLIDDPEILEQAIAEAERVVKGFDSPNSGILFTAPIGQVLGLKKWSQPQQKEQQELPEPASEENRLLQWFKEDVLERYGSLSDIDWTRQRNTTISEIIDHLELKPTIIKVDTPLVAAIGRLRQNPGMPAACVINTENRLVGVIPLKNLADVMMAPVMPEAYINDPDGYEKALKFADIRQKHIAASIMIDPIFVNEEETLEETYRRMKEKNLSGLPVVDKFYRVTGFITMLELMGVCFPENSNLT